MSSLIGEFKNEFRKDNMITRLILVNAGIFIAVLLVKLFIAFSVGDPVKSRVVFSQFIDWLAVPYDLSVLIFRPWTLITYMFLHFDFWHIFWNMIFLFWFGKLLREYLGNSKVLPVYIYGGLGGAALAIIFYYLFPSLPIGPGMLGASGAVYAEMLATAALLPNHAFHLLLIGPVKIKYIVLFRFIFDLIALSDLSNMGGHVAHIGGALMGYYFIRRYRGGRDMSTRFNGILDALTGMFRPKPRIKVTYRKPISGEEYNMERTREQQKIDSILDKISKSGYESLTKEEKEYLFKVSNDKK